MKKILIFTYLLTCVALASTPAEARYSCIKSNPGVGSFDNKTIYYDPYLALRFFQRNAFVHKNNKLPEPDFITAIIYSIGGGKRASCTYFDEKKFEVKLSNIRKIDNNYLEGEFGIRISSTPFIGGIRTEFEKGILKQKRTSKADRLTFVAAETIGVGTVFSIGGSLLFGGGTSVVFGALSGAAYNLIKEAAKTEKPIDELSLSQLKVAMESSGEIEIWVNRVRLEENTYTITTAVFKRELGNGSVKRNVLYQIFSPDAVDTKKSQG